MSTVPTINLCSPEDASALANAVGNLNTVAAPVNAHKLTENYAPTNATMPANPAVFNAVPANDVPKAYYIVSAYDDPPTNYFVPAYNKSTNFGGPLLPYRIPPTNSAEPAYGVPAASYAIPVYDVPSTCSSADETPKRVNGDTATRSVAPREITTSAVNLSYDQCHKTFPKKSSLVRHLKNTCTEEKPYACDLCGRTFKLNKNMKTHRRVHTGEKPYTCGVCYKKFTSSSSLYKHRKVHTKPHKCDFCGKSFSQNWILTGHIRTHTGEKPYTCEFCGVSFSLFRNLTRHRRNMHTGKKPDGKPHMCATCGKTFVEKYTLIEHREKHLTERHSNLLTIEEMDGTNNATSQSRIKVEPADSDTIGARKNFPKGGQC